MPQRPAVSALPRLMAPASATPVTVSDLDGSWHCAADNADRAPFMLEIAGTTLRDPGSNTTIVLTLGKGLVPDRQLVAYPDPVTGRRRHALTMRQVEKVGYASFFSAQWHGGAGAGVEFSRNPNDTIKISDYSSMNGADAIGRAILLTCLRQTYKHGSKTPRPR